SKARASISAAPARKIAVTNTLRHCRLSALSVGIFAHHDARLAHQGHVQFLSRHLLDAGVRRPGALLELQLSPFHGQRIALGLQLLQLHEGGAVAMAGFHDRQRAAHAGQQQHGNQHPDVHDAASSRSATRNTALRARTLRATSSSLARLALPTSRSTGGGGFQGRPRGSPGGGGAGRAWARMKRFTRRSSSEWELITASRPPGSSTSRVCASTCSRSSNSLLISICSAWNLWVAARMPRTWVRTASATSSPSPR